ncbi:MAG: efflux RND transporter periplasmic adaptor subunit [Planctomycetota bacterium]|nr:efflux RND transporter periplasmic adaptor subunit [Planctomycetota bacterium]
MRSFVAYVLALLATSAGIWFGFYADAAAEGNEAPRRPLATPVILAPVVEAPFSDKLTALGTAVANESVALTANRSDLVQAVHFDDGEQVAAGQVLVELQVAEERSMLAEAKAVLTEREAAHRRALELSGKGIAPDRDVQAAQAQLNAARSRVQTLEVAIRDHVVRAPFAGVLGLRRVSVGSLLQSSTVITTLDDLSVVKVDFTIPETWLSAVRIGQPISARSDAWSGEEFTGKVTAIDTRLDQRTRSATVRAVVANPSLRLRPGMLIKVEIDRGEAPSRQVPEEALLQRGDAHFVYVVGDDDVALEVAVTVGRRQVGRVEVLSGLDEGQRVVVEGIVRVRDGSKVHVVEVRSGEEQ